MYRSIGLLLILFMLSGQAESKGKEFKGVITYKIEYSDLDMPEQMKAYLPQMLKIYFRGPMSKTVMNTGGGNTIKIKNGEERSVTTLVDMAGQKFAMLTTPEQIEEDLTSATSYKVEFKEETKVIAGHECKKAVLVPDNGEDWLVVYFTEDLGENVNYFDTPQYKEIPGIMLEFQMSTPQFNMTFIATDVQKKNVSKKEFEVPEDFEFKTAEEVQQMFGGN